MTVRKSPMRYSFALALAGLFSLTQPAAAASEAELRRAVDSFTTWIATLSEGAAKLTTAAPVRVEPDGQGLRVTLPSLRLVVKDKDQPGVDIELGTVSFVQRDVGPGRWRLQGALPSAMRIKEPSGTYEWTTGASRYAIELDPSDGLIYASELSAERLSGAVPDGQRVTIAGIQGKSSLADDGNGRWSSPVSMTLSELRLLNAKGQTLGQIGSIDATMKSDGVALDRARALQARISGLAGGKSPPDQATIEAMIDLVTKPSFIMRGIGYDLSLKGLVVSEDGGQPLGQLGELRFGFGITGLDTNAAAISWNLRHAGLEAAGAMPFDGSLLPKTGEIAFALRGIPVAEAIEAARAAFAGNPPPGAMDDPQQFVIGLLAKAGTLIEISKLEVEADKAGIGVKAEARADASSPFSAVGRAELSLRGLEAVVEAIDQLGLGPVDPAGVAVVAALGQQEKRPDGSVVRRYRFELKPDASLHLNDNDVTALISKTQGMFETAKTEPEKLSKEERQPGGQGDVIEKLSAEMISGLLEARGLEPETRQNQSGDPRILVRRGKSMAAEELWVEFTGCNSEGECDDAMIWAWVKPKPPAKLDKVNEWNGSNRWSRVYLDQDEDARIEMDIRAAGGVMPARLEEAVGQFMDILPRFIDRFAPP